MSKRLPALFGATIAACALAASLLATTASAGAGFPYIEAKKDLFGVKIIKVTGNNEYNNLQAVEDGGRITIYSNLQLLWDDHLGQGCDYIDEYAVQCPAGGIQRVRIYGRSANDRLDARALTSVPADVDGGPGADIVIGTDLGGETLRGGPDDSTDGNDNVIGQPTLDGPVSTGDWISLGGSKRDARNFNGLRQSGDEARGSSAVDAIFGESGPDSIWPKKGADYVNGGSGESIFWASDQESNSNVTDMLVGGSENDTFYARDGARDRLFCGLGNDKYQIDGNLDLLGTGQDACEKPQG